MTDLTIYLALITYSLLIFTLGWKSGRVQPRRSSLRPLQPVLPGSRVVGWARNEKGRN